MTRDKATIGRILKDNGYRTSWFGKDHNTPTFQASQDGPFDQWPIGMGFEYFYGFIGGDANQWQPNLFRNTTQIYPYVGNPGWNLTTAMADDAIAYMNRINALTSGAAVLRLLRARAARTRRTIRRRNGSRRSATCTCSTRAGTRCATQIFANQKKLGVIPQDAKLTPWPDDLLKNWDAADGGREEAVHPAGRRVCRLSRLHRPRDRPRDPGGRGHGQARQHADHLHQRRQRLSRRGHAGRHAERSRSCSTASMCRSRTSSSTSTTPGAPTRPTTTWRCRGPGRSTRRSPGPSRSRRTSAASARAWRSRGRR